MELISLAALAGFLAPFFTKAGETLATESVKLALEKREDIKNGFVKLFKHDEIIALGLNEEKTPEEVTALIKANPEVTSEITKKIESHPDLLKDLLEIIKEQAGKDSSNITINAEKIGQVINDNHGTINQTVNF